MTATPRRRRPVTTTAKAHPDALAKALEIAGGDYRRLVVEPGGSVLVRNAREGRRARP